MDNNTQFLRAQAVDDVARRLVDLLKSVGRKIKSVHVLPAEFTQWSGWDVDVDAEFLDKEEDQKKLNRLLGQQAVSYVSGELANTLAVNRFRYDEKAGTIDDANAQNTFRLGIATGSTIYSLVEHFLFPGHLKANQLEIVPLVMGPIPETVYSAGFIAEMLANKIHANLTRISEIQVPRKGDGIQVRMQSGWTRLRDLDDNEDIGSRGKNLAQKFQWVITGIGGSGGQLEEHIKQVYKGNVPKGTVGDICSRLFGIDGNELKDSVSDNFVAITFQALEQMCGMDRSGKRVIAIAGGRAKYHALRTLLLREAPDLFNVLITDELTARRLLIDIKKKT